MADRRRHTGTRPLQVAWTAAVAVVLVGFVFSPLPVGSIELAAVATVWLVGLFVLGRRERRHWRRLAANSAFEAGSPSGLADLQRRVGGRSVTVSRARPGPLSQARVVVSTAVGGAGPGAEVTMERVEDGRDRGLATGNPTLDREWILDGPPEVLEAVLSADVQAALMDVAVPGTLAVEAERVTFTVPFTRLTPGELAGAARSAAAVADRLERLRGVTARENR